MSILLIFIVGDDLAIVVLAADENERNGLTLLYYTIYI